MAYKRFRKFGKFKSKRFKPKKYTIYVARVTFKPLLRKKDKKPIRIKGWKNAKKFLEKLNQGGRKAYAKKYSKRRF